MYTFVLIEIIFLYNSLYNIIKFLLVLVSLVESIIVVTHIHHCSNWDRIVHVHCTLHCLFPRFESVMVVTHIHIQLILHQCTLPNLLIYLYVL